MRLLLLLILPIVAYAAPAPAAPAEVQVLHEKRSDNPLAWRKIKRAASHDVIQMKFALKQRNIDNADQFLHSISDPDSPEYGQHWTAEQVANVFAPAKKTVHSVANWLVGGGIDRDRLRHRPGRHWIEVNATIAEAQRLLNTEYYVFQHGETNGYRVGCDSYSLPATVKDHIDFVMPTVQLDGLRPAKIMEVAQGSNDTGPAYQGLHGLKYCGTLVSIECLRALYNFSAGVHDFSNNMMGIPEWEDYLYYPDLVKYFQNWTSPRIPDNVRPNFVSIDGGKTANRSVVAQGLTSEPALDFNLAYSIVYPQKINYFEVGDGVNVDSVGTFNIFLDALDGSYCDYLGGDQPYLDPTYPDDFMGGWQGNVQCGGAPKSSVISVSYYQYEAALPEFYQRRQCHEWMKLGLQGVSVVFSSGDSGVANRYNAGFNNTCVNADLGTVDQFGTRFNPGFPVNCPYVTSAGATQLKTGNLSDGEVAVADPDPKNPYMDFYSGGGFSSVFPRPSWQNSAVSTYLDKYVPDYNSSVYNKSGRGIPDVSAMGINIPAVIGGKTVSTGGTSASAPIFASILNLLNGERIAAGKKTIGFVNPILYKHPEMFNDITEGDNPGCGTKGFPASPGWDPVTGLGSPNYPKMREVFLSLP